jgi:hypothetical protein
MDLVALICDMSVSLDGYTNGAHPSPRPADGRGRHAAPRVGVRRRQRRPGRARQGVAGQRRDDLRPQHLRPLDPGMARGRPVAGQATPAGRNHPLRARRGPANSVYSFATGGIEAALEEARDRADGGDIAIMCGPSVGGQYARSSSLDVWKRRWGATPRRCSRAARCGRHPAHRRRRGMREPWSTSLLRATRLPQTETVFGGATAAIDTGRPSARTTA